MSWLRSGVQFVREVVNDYTWGERVVLAAVFAFWVLVIISLVPSW